MLRSILPLAAAVLLSAPAFAQPAPMQFRATLDGASSVPPVQAPGKGVAMATLDPATRKLTYTVQYSGLSGPATAAHIHGPADAKSNAGVLVPLANPASPIEGSATLTEAQVKDVEGGKAYINVHTAAHPGGELRGQLVRAP